MFQLIAPSTPTATSLPLPSPSVTPSADVPPVLPTIVSSPSPSAVQPQDAAPLLSTLVQSGAALVAIIAGLLVARLVALLGERTSLERRVGELSERLDARRSEYEAAYQERLDDDGDHFTYHALEHYFSGDVEEPTFETAYAAYDDEPGNGEALQPYYDRFAGYVKLVAGQVGELGLLEDDKEAWEDDAERQSVLQRFRAGIERDIAEKLLDDIERLWEGRRLQRRLKSGRSDLSPFVDLISPFNRPTPFSIAFDSAQAAASRQITSAHYARLEANEERAKSAMEDAERELAHAGRALAAVSKPQGLVLTIVLLGVIALFGMVLPLIQMTIGQTMLSAAWRWAYTGLFLASLIAFFAYLVAEVVRLTRRPEARGDVQPNADTEGQPV